MYNLTPVQGQWVTLAFVVAATIMVLGYDVLAIRAWGVDASISRVMKNLFTANPSFFAAVIFWLGVLVGHCWLHTG